MLGPSSRAHSASLPFARIPLTQQREVRTTMYLAVEIGYTCLSRPGRRNAHERGPH
jgi:hypothetical protein